MTEVQVVYGTTSICTRVHKNRKVYMDLVWIGTVAVRAHSGIKIAY